MGKGAGRVGQWKDKLGQIEARPARDLLKHLHPENWRGHPGDQREMMRKILDRVGWVAPVIVSKRSGRVIDGEMRIQIAAEQDEMIQVQFVYLDEEEERIALATFDAIGELAQIDEGMLDKALQAFAKSGNDIGTTLQRPSSSPVAAMVDAAASGTVVSNLWRSEEVESDDGHESDEDVLTDDYDCLWVRIDAGFDQNVVVEALNRLQDEFDVVIEGPQFKKLS